MKRRALRGTMPSHSMCGAPWTWQRKPSSAYFSARTMPDLPSLSEATTSWVLFPMEETTPIPVTTTRRIDWPSPCLPASPLHPGSERGSGPFRICGAASSGRRLLSPLEQTNPQVCGGVDHLPIRLHDAVGDRQFQLAQDDPLQVDDVLHGLGAGHHHAGELD